MRLRKFVLLSAAGLGAAAPSLTRQELETCLTGAVGGDASRAQFRHEANYTANDVNYFNLNLQYNPITVVYPNSTKEISDILGCATKNNRTVAARSGGRDFINKCLGGQDDAVVVDLKHFNGIKYDASSQVATIGPGNVLQGTFEALNEHGRALPLGSPATVGIGGHIVVGGMGYLSRQHGLAIDNLLEAEVVLANGTVVRASKDQNQDLFWALRGAGSSFGIVTEFKFQTKPKPQELVTFSYTYTSNQSAIAGAIKAYQKIIGNTSTSRKLGASGTVMNGMFALSGAFFGTKAEFEALNLGSQLPAADNTTVTTGVAWMDFMNGRFTASRALPSQNHFYARDAAMALDTLASDDSIERFVNYTFSASFEVGTWLFLIDFYGGAINDVARDATAFPHRNSAYFVSAQAITGNQKTTEASQSFIDKALETLQGGQPGKYLNYWGVPVVLGRLSGTPQEKYWGANLPRLEQIKASVDPKDVFSTPQNVKPKAT